MFEDEDGLSRGWPPARPLREADDNDSTCGVAGTSSSSSVVSDSDRPSTALHIPPFSPVTVKQTQACCYAFARRCFPAAARDPVGILPAYSQGYCSYTLFVGADTVLQFRPPEHRLDVALCEHAREVYGALAPSTRSLGTVAGCSSEVHAYAMSRVSGVPLSMYRLPVATFIGSPCSVKRSPSGALRGQEDLVRDFARFFALGWHAAVGTTANPRLPGPGGGAAPSRGRIGSSMRWRLELLRDGLPQRFRPVVQRVLAVLPRIEGTLPWVLTHGDVVPGNIMIRDPARLSLTGLLDWAEAEYLPFGVGLYGLEELLGESSSGGDQQNHAHYPAPGSSFKYYLDAPALRAAFWDELEAAIPSLRRQTSDPDPDQSGGLSGPSLRATVEAAELLGILLWHGIAFDGGRLDRVVREGGGDAIDDAEIQRLDVFLLSADGHHPSDDQDVGTEDMIIIDPDEAILEEVVDEDDLQPEQQQKKDVPESGSSSQSPSTTPEPNPGRGNSIGDAARSAWDYVRRLPLPLLGKL